MPVEDPLRCMQRNGNRLVAVAFFRFPGVKSGSRLFGGAPGLQLVITGANDRNRTDDLFITSELLYRLSYIGLPYICII